MDEEKKRISELPTLYPSKYDEFVMLGNQSDVTGTMSSNDMVTNYLEHIISASDNFEGLNSYIHKHGGGDFDFEDAYSSFFYHVYQLNDYTSVTEFQWQMLAHKSQGSYYTFWANSFIHAHVDKYIENIPEITDDYENWYDFRHWVFINLGEDDMPAARVWANSYLSDYVDKYLYDAPHQAPQYIDDTDRVLLYGVDPDEGDTWKNYITLSELAEYIKNYNPPT